MNGKVLNVGPLEIALLDEILLDDDDRIKLLPAEVYQTMDHEVLQAWCATQARYGIPTLELITWLKERIGDRKAIEIGAGNGDLGYHLGITQTDSCIQQSDAMQLAYGMGCQVTTNPKPDVLRLDAEQAVQKLKPDVVIASWVTRKFMRDKDVNGEAQAFAHGPEEQKVLRGCAEYIHIGNLAVHGQKTLLSLPHETYYFPWLVSRGFDQTQNVIYVWKNPHYPTGRRK